MSEEHEHEHDALGFTYPPPDAELPNAGDAKAQKAAKQIEARTEQARRRVMRQIMGSNEGRALIYHFLDLHGVFATLMPSGGALNMAFNEGQRATALWVLALMQRACPERYIEMLKEANGERS